MIALLTSLLLAQASLAKVPSTPLWNEWYLISVDGTATSYFQETAERRPTENSIAITQNWVEADGSEVYIGSVSSAEKDLRPIAFFSVRKSKTINHKIDARTTGKKLIVTLKQQNKKASKIEKSIEIKPGLYLSSFLPMAVSRKIGEKGAFQFNAVVEESHEEAFEVRKGIVEVTGESKKVNSMACHGALIQIDGTISEWWITKDGKVCEVSYPSTNTKMVLTTEEKAKKALEGK